MKTFTLFILLYLSSVLVGMNLATAQTFPDRVTHIKENVEFTWLAPTTRIDGSTLSPESIYGYEIYVYNADSPEGSERVYSVEGGDVLSMKVTDLHAGNYMAAIRSLDVYVLQNGDRVAGELTDYKPFTLNEITGSSGIEINVTVTVTFTN